MVNKFCKALVGLLLGYKSIILFTLTFMLVSWADGWYCQTPSRAWNPNQLSSSSGLAQLLFGLCSQFLPVIDLPNCRVKFVERMRRQSGPFSVCILDVDIPMGGVAWEEIREKQRATGGDNFAWFTLMPVSPFSVTTSKGTSSLVGQDFFLCLYKAACIA
jgi:hypothetical protein